MVPASLPLVTRAFLGGFVRNACQRKYGRAEKARQRWINGKSTGDHAKQAEDHRARDAGISPAPVTTTRLHCLLFAPTA
jgi:hypothetical protein